MTKQPTTINIPPHVSLREKLCIVLCCGSGWCLDGWMELKRMMNNSGNIAHRQFHKVSKQQLWLFYDILGVYRWDDPALDKLYVDVRDAYHSR